LLKAKSIPRRLGLNRLYELNPGGMLQYGFALPLAVNRGDSRDRVLRRCVRHLKRSGSEMAPVVDEEAGFVYRLDLRRETENQVRVTLRRGEEDRQLFSKVVSLGAVGTRRRAAALARAVMELIYTVRR
jgi:hypothetical protein